MIDSDVLLVGGLLVAAFAIPAGFSAFSEGRPPRAAAAALALGALHNERPLSDLIALLTDGNSMVREAAAQALGAIGSARAVPALQEAATRDTKSKVRKAAQAALEAIAARKRP